MSQVHLAKHRGSSNWGDRKLNQHKSNQIKSNVGIWWEGKTGVPVENPLGAEWRTNKLNPQSNPGHIGGRPVLSPLCQHCSQRKTIENMTKKQPISVLVLLVEFI